LKMGGHGLTLGGSASVAGAILQQGSASAVMTGMGALVSGAGTWKSPTFVMKGETSLSGITLMALNTFQIESGKQVTGGTGTIVLSGGGNPWASGGTFTPESFSPRRWSVILTGVASARGAGNGTSRNG